MNVLNAKIVEDSLKLLMGGEEREIVERKIKCAKKKEGICWRKRVVTNSYL